MYDLRPSKPTKKMGWFAIISIAVFCMACMFLVATVVIIYMPIKALTKSDSAPSIVTELIAKVVAHPSLAARLRERASGCSDSDRLAFLEKAVPINDAFQDSFMLALQTPKIGLSPVVGDMQKSMRELEQLKPDPCGQIAQTHLLNEFEYATQTMLSFMAYGLDLDSEEKAKKLAEVSWFGAYRADMAGPFLIDDAYQLKSIKETSQAIPTNLQYLELFNNNKLGCEDAHYVQQVFISVLAEMSKTDGIWRNQHGTPTPAPCIN